LLLSGGKRNLGGVTVTLDLAESTLYALQTGQRDGFGQNFGFWIVLGHLRGCCGLLRELYGVLCGLRRLCGLCGNCKNTVTGRDGAIRGRRWRG
jgi:hypothetical protein